METSIWEKVLIDWVNCLKLSKPIQKLQDLKDGIFFGNLQKVIKKSTDIEQDMLTCLFHVLNQHYPKFIIENIANIHINDINNKELFHITSLLMHYTCIHDRRDVLTSPLCHNLQQTTQICIKSFLEKVQEYSELTNESLHKIITCCEEEMEKFANKESVQCLFASSAESRFSESPLQYILKTPSTKGSRLMEKDKEIVRLKTDLEIVQEEKDNVEDDLKIQIDRNKKLESQLTQKKLEISRLRSEVVALESRTPPYYQDKDSREVQKILRTKIESLEKIIEQCDAENQELLEQRDADRLQLKLLESQSKTWLEKFLETDNNLQILTEHSKEQESKLQHLQNHCNEIETLLGELQHKSNGNESFTEESFHGTNINRRSKTFYSTPSCEDLAQSVVDVQLREKQKENEEIKKVLSDTKDGLHSLKKENQDLQTEIANLLAKQAETADELNKSLMVNEDLLQENTQLLEKMKIMSNEVVDLVKRNKDIKEQLSCITDQKNNIQKLLASTEEESKSIFKQKSKIECENIELMNKLENVTNEKEQFESFYHEKVKLIKKLELDKNNLESRISELSNDLQKSENFIKEKLENFSKEKSSLTDEISNLNEINRKQEEELMIINQQACELIDTKQKLQDEFDKLMNENHIMKTEILSLNNELKEVIQQKDNLLDELEIMKKENSSMASRLVDLNNNYKQLSEEKLKQIDQLELVKAILTKEFESFSLQKTEEITQLIEERNNKEEELSKLKSNLQDLVLQKDFVEEELNNKKRENDKENQRLTSENLALKSQISNLNNEFNKIMDHKNVIETEISSLKNEFKQVMQQKRNILEELDIMKKENSSMAQEVLDLKDDYKQLSEEKLKRIEQLELEKATMTKEFDSFSLQKTEEITKLIEERNNKEEELSQLKSNIQELVLQKDLVEENLKNTKRENAKENQILTSENSTLKSQISNLNNEFNKIMDEKNVIETEISSLNKEFKQVMQQKDDILEELDITKKENSSMAREFLDLNDEYKKLCEENLKQNEQLELEKATLTKQFGSFSLQKTEEITQLIEERNNKEEELLKVKSNLQDIVLQKNLVEEELNNVKTKNTKENQELTSENLTLKSQISNLNNEFNKMMDEKNIIATEISSLNKEFKQVMQEKDNVLEELDIMKKENSSMAQELLDLNDAYNQICEEKLKQNDQLELEKATLIKEFDSFSLQKTEEIRQLLEERNNKEDEISKLNSNIQDLVLQTNFVEEKLNNLQTERTEENKKLTQENSALKDQISKLNEVIEELQEEKINQIQISNDEISELSSKINQLNGEETNTNNNYQSLLIKKSNDFAEFTKDKTLLQAENSTLNDKLQDIIKHKDQLQQELNKIHMQMTSKTDKLLGENLALTQLIAELNDKYREVHEEKINHNKNFEDEISKLEEEKLNLTKEINKINEIVKEKMFLEASTLDCNNKLQEISKKKEILQQEFDNYKMEKETQNDQLTQLISGLNNQLTEFQCGKMNEQFEDHILNLTSQMKQLEEENLSQENNKEIEKRELEEQISELTCEITQEKTNLDEQLNTVNHEKSMNIEQLMEVKSITLELKLQEARQERDVIQEKLDNILLEKANEIEELQHQVSNLDKIVNDLQEERNRENQQFTKLEFEKNDLEAKITELNNNLQALNEQKDILQQEKNVEFTKPHEIQRECQVENEILKSDEFKLSNETSRLNDIIQQVMEKNETLEKHILNMEQKQLCTKAERTSILNSITQLEQEKQVISNFLDLNNSERQKAIEEKERLLEALVMSNKEVENVNLQKKQLLVEISKISESWELSKRQLENMKEEIQNLNLKYAEAVNEKQKLLESEDCEAKKSLQTLEQEKRDLLLEISDKSDCLRNITNEIENLNKEKIEIESLQKEKIDLNNQLFELHLNLKKISEENVFLTDNFGQLLQEKADFSEQLDKVSQEKADVSKKLQCILKTSVEVADLMRKADQLSEDNAQLISKLTILSHDLEAKTKEVGLLELANKQMKKSIDEKSELLQKLTSEHNDVFEIVDRLSQEKSDMAQSIEVTLKELEKRSQEKSQLEQNLQELSNQYKKLDTEIVSLRESLEICQKELQKVKRERNELLQSQTKIMRETESNILLAHESAVEVRKDLMKKIELMELDKQNIKTKYDTELKKLRDAYAQVVNTNSRSEMEKMNLRKKIEEKNQQLSEYSQINEAYDKLLEENNKLMTEVDTIKYKRSRDREEFVNLLKKEREEADTRGNKKVREVRNEYEDKLEKMKDKMLRLYREEVNKEMQKVKVGQNESNYLQKTIEELRHQLFEAEQKIHLLETELDMKAIKEAQSKDFTISLRHKGNQYASARDSINSVRSVGYEIDMRYRPSSTQLSRKVQSVTSVNTYEDREVKNGNDRKIATLPKGRVKEIEETLTISKRTSISNGITPDIANLEMEDEDDDFNNKYLVDLKAGRCLINDIGRESNISRFSELAWRNSMVPPHLKSSYPAEMQFVSPTHFKEEEIKSGNVELDDSLSRLLPNEKPRQKKDFGTTSYKKPGPPTPSKNGGRLSLQGNEVQPLREQNQRMTTTPKKVTPSRIRALFMGRTNVAARENCENQCTTTPKGNNKRLSIFKKQK